MIKLKHLLMETERISFVNKRRARAELNQKIKGSRADDMGAYTGKIFGLEQEDQNAPRTEITRIEDLAKYSAFALGNANTPEIGNVGSVLKFKMPRKRAGLFFAPANSEYIDYKIDYEDDILDDEGKPETAYITVDAEYVEAAKKILDYMASGVYELITGDDEKGDKEESVLKAIETLKNVKYGVERRKAMEIVLAAAEARSGQKARTYKQALQMLDLEEPMSGDEFDVSGNDVKFEVVGPDEAEVMDAINILNRDSQQLNILNRNSLLRNTGPFKDELKVQDGTGRELNGQYVVTVTKTGGSEPRQYVIDSNKYLKDRGYDTELK